MENILCIDFLNLLYRSFYGLSEMRNSKNQNIGAIFSFIKILKKLLSEYKINKVIICNDSLSHKIIKYPYYKGNREKTPVDLLLQKDILIEYLQKINIPIITCPGYEADDIIYSLAHVIAEENKDIFYIVSGDKDLHPLLLLNNVFIIDHSKNILLNKDYLEKKYISGVNEDKLYLYYSLCGDQIDNIPGVKGIGSKTALKIIQLYNSLDDLYIDFEDKIIISPRIKKLLLDNKNKAYESFELIFPSPVPPELLILFHECQYWKEENFYLGNDILLGLECNSIVYKPFYIENKDCSSEEVKIECTYAKDTFITKILQTIDDVDLLIDNIKRSSIIAIDTETSSGNPQLTTVLGFSICVEESVAWYIPLYIMGEKNQLYEDIIAIFRFLTSDKICIMHNALFDLHALSTIGVFLNCFVFDTMITAYIFKEFKIGLKELSIKFFNQKMQSFSEVMEFGVYKTFDEVPLEKAAVYAATDARQTFLLYYYFENLLKKEENKSYNKLLFEIEMPIIKVLQHIESSGIYCDKEILLQEEKKYVRELEIIKLKIKDIADSYSISLNPMSNKQTRIFLYDILQLPHNKYKKTDQLTLSTIELLHPIVPLLLSYRSLQSNISHFTTGLLKYIKTNNKIYTHYQQFVTNTGRITTINPNLQNIPRSDGIYKIRNAFHAAPQNVLVSFDYSQIELRILAHFSEDSTLCDLFSFDRDIHALTAKILFNKNDNDEITLFERQVAKKINFSIIYGQSAYNLSKDLKITLKEAKDYLEVFKKNYSGVFKWMDKVIEAVKKEGFVCTLYGMKRLIPEILDGNKNIFKSGCRIAINTIIQGTAAEVMKKAMINVYQYIQEKNTAKIVLQIHDELLIEMPSNDADLYIKEIQYIMEKSINLKINLKVNVAKNIFWQ